MAGYTDPRRVGDVAQCLVLRYLVDHERDVQRPIPQIVRVFDALHEQAAAAPIAAEAIPQVGRVAADVRGCDDDVAVARHVLAEIVVRGARGPEAVREYDYRVPRVVACPAGPRCRAPVLRRWFWQIHADRYIARTGGVAPILIY